MFASVRVLVGVRAFFTGEAQLGKQIFQVATDFFELDCVAAAIWTAFVLLQPLVDALGAELAITVGITAHLWVPCHV